MEPIMKTTQEEQSPPNPESISAFQCNESKTSLDKCALCSDTGYKMEKGLAVLCECSIERRIAALLPQLFRQASLEAFSEEIRELVIDWVTSQCSKLNHYDRTSGLLITGPVGTGKSYLAAAILRLLVEEKIPVKFCRCADFFAKIRETYQTNRSEETVLKPLEQVQLLIFDDLGAGSLSDHERRFTLELLDRRLNNCKPTIVTTNWGLGEIAARMDDRIASRLSTFAIVELGGEDRRIRLRNGHAPSRGLSKNPQRSKKELDSLNTNGERDNKIGS